MVLWLTHTVATYLICSFNNLHILVHVFFRLKVAMLKWAITPRISNEFFDQTSTNGSHDSIELLNLQAIIEQHQLPCLVRFVNDDLYDSYDNYCLLLCETKDPYLIVSNETERFSIPISFDGKILV